MRTMSVCCLTVCAKLSAMGGLDLVYGPQLAVLPVHPETLPFGPPTTRKGAVTPPLSPGMTNSCPQVKHNTCIWRIDAASKRIPPADLGDCYGTAHGSPADCQRRSVICHVRQRRSPSDTCLCSTDVPRSRLSVDSRLLGIRPARLHLDRRSVGTAASTRHALDPCLLGMGRRPLPLSRGLL